MKSQGKRAVFLILLLAAVLRLPNLETIPFWEFDEGYNLNYAWNLANGHIVWYTIRYAFIPHPPLFYMILAVIIKLFGYTLYPARVFAVTLSLGSTLLLYLAGTKLVNKNVGLLAALLYAIYPHAIFFGRMNYNNNLLAFMIMLALYLHLLEGRWRTLSYAVIGLSAVVELSGAALILTAWILSRIFDKKNFLKNMGIALAPGIIFTLIMLYITPDYFVHDLLYQLNRFGFTPTVLALSACALAIFYLASDRLPEIYVRIRDFLRREITILFSEYDSIAWNYGLLAILAAAHFYSSRWLFHEFSEGCFFGSFDYYWLGLAGLLLVRGSIKRNTALLFALPMLLVTLKIGRFDHMCIPLYPLFSLGGGVLLPELNGFLRRAASLLAGSKILIYICSTILLAYPFTYVLYADFGGFVLGRTLRHEDVKSMVEAAEYVNARISGADFVLTTSNLARFVRGNATVFIQGVAIDEPIVYYPAFPAERFLYNVSYRNAKYIVIPGYDGLSWLATVENRTYRNISEEIGGWGVEMEIGPYFVYRNPEK